MRVLLVEDEPDLARVIRRTLEEEGHACDHASEGWGALHQAQSVAYDAIVLDLMLPGLDGWSLLAKLRKAGSETPVLVLTARDAVQDRVRGLDLGADDYLTKPFSLEELLARLRALRRRSIRHPNPVIEIDGIEVHTSSRTVHVAGVEIPLTAKEYAVLELLASKRGQVVTRSDIYVHLYDDDQELLSNVVEVYVASLRRKLGHGLIRTRRGHGYLIP